MFPKPTRWESKKYRDGAKGQPCTMRLPGICNGNPETTVLAHANGAGMGMKADDFDAADMCSDCHSAFDQRTKCEWDKEQLQIMFGYARYQTIRNRILRGILK